MRIDRRLTSVTLASVVLMFVALGWFSGAHVADWVASLRSLATREDGLFHWAFFISAAFTYIAALLPIPAEAPALLNGALFSPLLAFGITYVFAYLGAATAFEVGRLIGYQPVPRLIGADRMAKIERLIATAGWPTLLALRLSPIMAFTALNWVSGVLALSRPVFYWTLAAGLMPGTFIITITPHVLEQSGSFKLYLLIGFSLVAMLLAVSYLRIRRRR